MPDFNLVSVDWDTVRIIQGGQFKQETSYLEELVRWTLMCGRTYGLLHLADNGISLPSPEGERMFSVAVQGCYAVGHLGYLIAIPDEKAMALRATIEARTPTVPLFVGASIVERGKVPEISPSVDIGLLQCGGRHRQYRLASDDSDESVDWLQIAQFERTPAGLLQPDPNFLPECMFLNSHDGQVKLQREIQRLAGQALEVLVQHSADDVRVYAAAAALAGSLGSAARMVDGHVYPRAYVDRLVGVLTAQYAQLRALPKPDLVAYQQALDQLDTALTYFDTADWTMGQAFLQIRECFDRLLKLYPGLLASLKQVGPPQERIKYEQEIVVPAEIPPTEQRETRRGKLWRP